MKKSTIQRIQSAINIPAITQMSFLRVFFVKNPFSCAGTVFSTIIVFGSSGVALTSFSEMSAYLT